MDSNPCRGHVSDVTTEDDGLYEQMSKFICLICGGEFLRWQLDSQGICFECCREKWEKENMIVE